MRPRPPLGCEQPPGDDAGLVGRRAEAQRGVVATTTRSNQRGALSDPVAIDQVAGPQRTLVVLQNFGVQLLSAEARPLVQAPLIRDPARVEVHLVVGARHDRAGIGDQLAQENRRLRGAVQVVRAAF